MIVRPPLQLDVGLITPIAGKILPSKAACTPLLRFCVPEALAAALAVAAADGGPPAEEGGLVLLIIVEPSRKSLP